MPGLLFSLITDDLVQAEPTLCNLEVNEWKLCQNKGSGRTFICTKLKNKIL